MLSLMRIDQLQLHAFHEELHKIGCCSLIDFAREVTFPCDYLSAPHLQADM